MYGCVQYRDEEAAGHHRGDEPHMVVPGHDGIEKVIGAAEAAGGDAAADGVERRPQEEQPRETENVPLEKVPELKPFAREHQEPRQHEEDGDTAA